VSPGGLPVEAVSAAGAASFLSTPPHSWGGGAEGAGGAAPSPFMGRWRRRRRRGCAVPLMGRWRRRRRRA